MVRSLMRPKTVSDDVWIQAEARVAAFLGALFLHIAEDLERDQDRLDFNPCTIINKLFRLSSPTDPWRHHTLSTIVSKAVQSLKCNAELCQSGPTCRSDDIKWHHELFETFCLDPVRRVAKMLKGQHEHVIIGFDECRHLNETPFEERTSPSSRMSVVALRRIIKSADAYHFANIKLWCTLLDTDSSIFCLIPPNRVGDSNRLTGSLSPLPPWPYLGFDEMVLRDFVGTPTPLYACKVDHLKMYGQPVCSALRWVYWRLYFAMLSCGRQKVPI
jgi:hypothetical protein